MVVIAFSGCENRFETPKSNSGVSQVTASVATNPDGTSVEQENILKRLKIDNTPGSVKHLYIISATSGQVLLYSTVQGKVTSSGKRLTPKTINWVRNQYTHDPNSGIPVNVGGLAATTTEVLQDDGTYGDSIDYLYWFDVRGAYHQHYISNCEIHVSDQPIAVDNVILNLELVKE